MKNQSENAAHRPQPIPPTGAGVGTRRRCARPRLWPGDLPCGSSCDCCHTENRGHDRRWGTCFTAVATWRVRRAAAPRHVATSIVGSCLVTAASRLWRQVVLTDTASAPRSPSSRSRSGVGAHTGRGLLTVPGAAQLSPSLLVILLPRQLNGFCSLS